jgi:hypothetical protein
VEFLGKFADTCSHVVLLVAKSLNMEPIHQEVSQHLVLLQNSLLIRRDNSEFE